MDKLEGIRPFRDKILQNNFLFALEWKDGFVFGRVLRRRIMHFKPWFLIDSNGAAVDIAANSTQAELRFRDPRNTEDDLLFLDSTTKAGLPWIMHGAMGWAPAQVYVYYRFPESQDIPGKFPEADPIKPASGDNLGYVSGEQSPYEEPTDFVELVIPPTQRLGAEYFNKDTTRAHRAKAHILFGLYFFQALKTGKHAPLIGKIARREVPASFLTVGFGDFPLDMGADLIKDWDVNPLKLDDAAELR